MPSPTDFARAQRRFATPSWPPNPHVGVGLVRAACTEHTCSRLMRALEYPPVVAATPSSRRDNKTSHPVSTLDCPRAGLLQSARPMQLQTLRPGLLVGSHRQYPCEICLMMAINGDSSDATPCACWVDTDDQMHSHSLVLVRVGIGAGTPRLADLCSCFFFSQVIILAISPPDTLRSRARPPTARQALRG